MIKNWLNYYLRSKTIYDIHSPFVYQFITTAIQPATSIEEEIKNAFEFVSYPLCQIDKIPTDAEFSLYLPQNDHILIKKLKKKLLHPQKDCFLIIEGIHFNAKQNALWEDLKSSKDYQLSLDLYHYGAIWSHAFEGPKQDLTYLRHPLLKPWSYIHAI